MVKNKFIGEYYIRDAKVLIKDSNVEQSILITRESSLIKNYVRLLSREALLFQLPALMESLSLGHSNF